MKTEEKKEKGSRTVDRIISVLLLLSAAAAIWLVVQIYPYGGWKGSLLAGVILFLLGILLLYGRDKFPKLVLAVSILLVVILGAAVIVMSMVNSAAERVSNTAEYEIVQIAALKGSGITAEDDFSSYTLGYAKDDGEALSRGRNILEEENKKIKKEVGYENMKSAYRALTSEKLDLIVLTSNSRSDLSLIDEEYENRLNILFEKRYPLQTADLKPVDISSQPFTVYLCGVDLSAGQDITSTGRGDVNLLLTVNPKTGQTNMQVIPRDTFVYIKSREGSSKLSYSGWWGGVKSSVESIEDKFGIDINYYAKINFNGLVDLVDALGGVTVYSHYTYSYQGYDFVKGENYVDGQKALRFVRARKMLPQNELSRGQHQMELLKGIFRKFSEDPDYGKAVKIADALSENFVTNIPRQDYYKVYKLVRQLLPQLSSMENHSVEGEYKWHYDQIRKGYYQYYFYPAEGEVEKIRQRIDGVLQGKKV